jgi:hypothetical protein
MKEAELMIEWLRQGSHVPFEEYNTSNEIRQLALDLAMFEGNSNTHTAAVLLVRACLRFTKENCSVHMRIIYTLIVIFLFTSAAKPMI